MLFWWETSWRSLTTRKTACTCFLVHCFKCKFSQNTNLLFSEKCLRSSYQNRKKLLDPLSQFMFWCSKEISSRAINWHPERQYSVQTFPLNMHSEAESDVQKQCLFCVAVSTPFVIFVQNLSFGTPPILNSTTKSSSRQTRCPNSLVCDWEASVSQAAYFPGALQNQRLRSLDSLIKHQT